MKAKPQLQLEEAIARLLLAIGLCFGARTFALVLLLISGEWFLNGNCHRIRSNGLADGRKRFWIQLNNSKMVTDRPYVSLMGSQ